MTPEFWAIIGVGIGISSVFGTLFTILNMRISDLRKDMREDIVRSEKRTSDKIDAVEKNLGDRIDAVEKNLGDRIDAVEKNLGDRIDAVEARVGRVETELGTRIDGVEARIDGVEGRLRVVEHGQARVIGAVDMMQTIVVATLRGEEVNAD